MAITELSRKTAARAGLSAFVCLIVVGTCLALSLAVAKLADEAAAPRLTFLMAAMAGAGIVLSAITAFQRQPMSLNRRMLEYALVSGALLALPQALGFLAVRHVGAGFVSLSFAFPILVTWVLAVLLNMEHLRVLRLLGVLLGLSGGVLLASAKAGGADGTGVWVALVLTMPLVIALGNIYRTLRWPGKAAPVFLAALMLFGAALTLLPFSLLLEPGQFQDLVGTTTAAWLLFLEVVVFSVLYFFYFVLQKLAGPVYLSQIGTVAAVAGTLIAVTLLNETPPSNLGLAGILVALGIILFQRGAPQLPKSACST